MDTPEKQNVNYNPSLVIATLGIVYGDIGTSPMYAVSESMRASGSPHSPASVLGVTSLIFWTLALIV